jgi:polyhydroxybutyrate depolymerase
LHGFTGNGQWQSQWPQLDGLVDTANIILVSGEGTVNAGGDRFWNATDACCDLYGTGVDDVAWLTSVLDEVVEHFPVDEDRVYFTGLSNGGFMSYRMACELSERVAAIASVAGMDFADDDACSPEQSVSVLHIHGTADETVPYNGSNQGWTLPSAGESVERWAGRAGCDVDDVTDEGSQDYVTNLPGEETETRSWLTGCAEGRSASLWTILDGPHVPFFNDDLSADLVNWLLQHSR